MRTLAILAALLACALPAPASAQNKLEPPDLEDYLRWGPLRARPGLSISDLGYDSNILYARGDEEPVGDYTGKLSPRLDGLVLFGDRAFLTFTERLDFAFYLQNGNQNFIDQRSKARLTVPFRNRRVGLFADLRWDVVNERPVDLQDIRPERKESQAGMGLILRPGWKTEIEIGRSLVDFSYRDPDYPDPETAPYTRLNRREASTTVLARYRLFSRTRLMLDGSLSSADFDGTFFLDGRETTQDQRELRVTTGLEIGAGGPLTGWFKFGWSRIDAKDPALFDLSEPVAEARVAYSFSSHTRVRLEGQRSPGLALWGTNPFYINSELGVRVVRYLNRTFGLEGGGALGRLTFPGSELAERRKDDVARYDVGIRLRLFRNELGRTIEYSMRVGRYRRESTIPEFDLSRNTFTIGAVLGYQD